MLTSLPPDPSAPRSVLEATLRFALSSGAWLVAGSPLAPADDSPVAQARPEVGPAAALTAVRGALDDCRRCRLWEGRTRIVYGAGDPGARLLFVGDEPEGEEDRQGEPFVGPAGQLLDRMIAAIGLDRSQVYLANFVKCRPPEDRDASDDEAAACLPFLWRQIEAVRPRVICVLGARAARRLLGAEGPLGRLRGSPQTARGFTVLPTFHPAYLLRNPQAKRLAWEDLKKVRELLEA